MKRQYDKGWCDPDDEDDYVGETNDGEQDEYIDDEYDYWPPLIWDAMLLCLEYNVIIRCWLIRAECGQHILVGVIQR